MQLSEDVYIKPMRVMIVDHHELIRSGLAAMLAGELDVEVVAICSSSEEALLRGERTCPDIVLINLNMPRMNGLETTQALKLLCPHTRIILLAPQARSDTLLEALRHGASGYLLDDLTRVQLLESIRQVYRGDTSFHATLITQALRRLAATPQEAVPVSELTARELQVLQLLARGKTNREIAAELVISIGTVKIHVERIIAKLEVSDRTQAAIRALELGLVQLTNRP